MYRIYVLPLVDLSLAMEMGSPYWAMVRCLDHHPASVILLIRLKGPTNWWRRTHTEQSSGHSRWVAPANAGAAL